MPLPKIDLPIYDLTVPSTGNTIRVRPFTVKEEKLLLMALESKSATEIVATTKQVINNCILDGDVDIEKLPFFDVDYMFIFLRAKSIGESVTVNLTCRNTLEDGEECGNVFPTDMNISNCEVVDNNVSNDIRLTGNSGVKMRYPGYGFMKQLEDMPEKDQKTFVIINSIDYIYDSKGMYSYKDYSKDELKEFVENLTEESYRKLEYYVDNFPAFVVRIDATCTKCGYEHHVRYSDFYDFFM